MNSRSVSMVAAALLACAGTCRAADAHERDQPPPAAVQAALAQAIAALPPPDYSAISETRHAAAYKSGEFTLLSLDGALGMSVVVVLDEDGVPHTECVESAPPPVQEPER